jgi:hypothetical protein
MPAHDFELEEALQEVVSMKWLSTIKSVDGGSMTIEKMKLDDRGFPAADRRVPDAGGEFVRASARQDVDLSLLDHAPGVAIENDVA